MRLAAAFTLLIAVCPAAVSAQARNEYQAAVAARAAGKPAEAKRLLQSWLAAHPADVDARLQLAYVELALGNLHEAQREFDAVLRQAPDYRDARDGLALVAARRSAADTNGRSFLLLEGAVSDLSGGAPNWHEVGLEGELPAGSAATIGGRVSYYRRFGLEDIELIGRAGLHPSENLWLRAHIGGTPNAQFRPEFSFGGGGDFRLSSGNATVLTFDGSYQRFPLQNVVTVNPGVVQYLGNGRGWVTLRGIGTVADGGRLQVGALVRGDYVPDEGWRLFVGAANGPDTDLGVITRVTSLFGGIEAPISERFALTSALARDWRNSVADRTELRLGVKARF